MVTLKEKQELVGNRLFAVDFTSEEGFSRLLGKLSSLGIDVSFENDFIGIRAILKKDRKSYVSHMLNIESSLEEATILYLDIGPEVSNSTAIINEKLFGITYDFTTPEGFVKLLSKLNEACEVTFSTHHKPCVILNEDYSRTGDTYAEALINAAYEMLK